MNLNIAILDMQPIDPPTGGGRLRLLGLYHGLGDDVEAHYVGTYDWRGPKFRRQMLSPTLEELVVPLTEAHFAAADALSKAANGGVVIDSAFHTQAHLSPDFVSAARKAAQAADVVVFSHPWIYPLVRDALDPANQLIVYDSHNVEGLLRMELLDDGATGTEVVRGVVEIEFEICHAAHLVLACSHEDRAAFMRLYGIPAGRIRLVPNGTFTRQLTPPTPEEKLAARKTLGIGKNPLAFFIGSNYGPNVDAARFIAATLAPALPQVNFAIAGGVCESLDRPLPANLRKAGLLSEEEKHVWLHAADIAINPMFGGSGTNIKMFDFMAAGLPIVSTQIGGRGIELARDDIVIADADKFSGAVAMVLAERDRAASTGAILRNKVDLNFSWERISADLGGLLRRWQTQLRRPRPYFSIVVPTYERHDSLTRLVERIAQQTWRDFELIIVDQSTELWPDRGRNSDIDLHYVHTDVRGAARARNRGADLARGEILAFIDDDCEPSLGWLDAARCAFSDERIAGLEGLITSNCEDSPEWRCVTNDGFEGIGFMTANFFVRTDVFHAVNGFDPAFEYPFREDTDLGWRVLELGPVPFCRDAWVYHPPQPRAVERESLMARSRFFESDALLLRKHPKKYLELFQRESQWAHNPYFWQHFLKGVGRHTVTLPREIRARIPARFREREYANWATEHALLDTEDFSSAAHRAQVVRMMATRCVTALYWSIFRREPDAAGLSYYVGEFSRGKPLHKIVRSMLKSDEFRKIRNSKMPNRRELRVR